MAETLFDELKRYVGFDAGDEAALRALHEVAAPRFAAIAEVFYEAIQAHEEARRVLAAGERQVGHLKGTLQLWMGQILRGPWDEDYFLAHCRIGQVHVRIGLQQHYMFGAMNVVRRQLNQVIDDHYLDRPMELAAARKALGKALDLELAVMLHTFREDLLAQQARVERLSTFGQLVGSIGHELRNPLGVIETSLFILKGRVNGDERSRKHLDRIGEQLQVANGIVSNLLDLIRDRPLARQRVELAEVVGAAAAAVPRPEGVLLGLEGLEGLPALAGDPGQLRQVFLNLVENAVHAASPRGAVRVGARLEGGQVAVSVEDTGAGVHPSVERRLFEPLITTKEKGIGLGLALVKRIVERHGGSVAHERRAEGGARFTVRLPV